MVIPSSSSTVIPPGLAGDRGREAGVVTKGEAMKLLGQWMEAIEHAQGILASQKAKETGRLEDSFRAECMAWMGLMGWLGLHQQPPTALGIFTRTREALSHHHPAQWRESGGSIPAEADPGREISRMLARVAALEPPVLNKSGGSDVEDPSWGHTLITRTLPACTSCGLVGHLAVDCPKGA